MRRPPGEGGRSTTDVPPRGLEERLRDTRAGLENDVGLWAAAPGTPDGVRPVPLSLLRDGTAFLVPTPRAPVTGRNPPADGRVRIGPGPTRDVALVDGTAAPVDVDALGAGTGDAFAAGTGFDPRRPDEPYRYVRVRPRRVRARREVNEMSGRALVREGRRLDGPRTAD
ncbi:pyridoxamine 5'-phosphate oxidase family protein [Streptomyces caelestis]|uniref:pyridoxamine 5'-phosphate oxidase family protein n=1 Tax=Streptomyces caelestis TaxID=36816 RepID=UPI00365D2395